MDYQFSFAEEGSLGTIGQMADTQRSLKTDFSGVKLRNLSLDVFPRQWIYGRSLIRGMLSVLGGTGGVGKTSFVMQVAISIAADRSFLAAYDGDPAHRIYEPHGTVMYYSLEDPMDDLIRQVSAILKYRDMPARLIWDRLILQSGRDLPLIVATQDDKGRLVRCDIDAIVAYLVENKVDVLVVDPFANSFDGGEGTESSADTMKIICDQWRLVAHRANCAIWLLHHFRKGGMAGEADAFRGSTTLQNAARIMETLTTMTPNEAEELRVDKADRRHHMRLENAKMNLGPASEGAWLKFVPVPLGNATEKYPQGDIIGVVTRWTATPCVITWTAVKGALEQIQSGYNGVLYSPAPKAHDRWAGRVVMSWLNCNRDKATEVLDDWIGKGVLYTDEIKDASRHTRRVVLVNHDAMARLKTEMESDRV